MGHNAAMKRLALETPPIPRDAFASESGPLWIMHCAEGPIPRSSAAAVRGFLDRELLPWTLRLEEDFLGLPAKVKEEGARLLSASPWELSLVPTTSSGLIQVAQGIDWKVGDEVLAALGEFPANSWPWKGLEARGVCLREVPLWRGHLAGARAAETLPPTLEADPEALLLDAISPATRVLTVSWVRFQDGYRLDLQRLAAGCAERGIAFVVDGIQGAGTLPVDLSGVSAFSTGGHKGLLAPQGLGLLWTSEAFRSELAPTGGWLSVEEATNFGRPCTDLSRRWLTDGRRFEQGVPNLLGCAALAASLGVINQAGVQRIADHVDRLQESLLGQLGDHPRWAGESGRLQSLRAAGRLGSILSFHHAGEGEASLQEILAAGQEAGIYASVREGYLRVALHGWHNAQDLERILTWLR